MSGLTELPAGLVVVVALPYRTGHTYHIARGTTTGYSRRALCGQTTPPRGFSTARTTVVVCPDCLAALAKNQENAA